MPKQLTRPLQLALKYWEKSINDLNLPLYLSQVLPMKGFKKALGLGIIVAATNGTEATIDCSSLLANSKSLIPGLQPYSAQYYSAGTTFSTPDASPRYNTPVPNLSAFCRFGAEFNTSTDSKFRFEVWMPNADQWNGRFAFVGNGGYAGGVNYPDMGIPLSKYGFAVASTDTGHNGTSEDGSFTIGNPETQYCKQIDFGYRAVHMSTEFSKKIVEQYYGKPASYNYWIGCSSGGKQGMKSIQKYPEDYDGVVAGAPAQWWTHLSGFLVHVNLLNSQNTTPGAIIPTSFFPALFEEVTSQCDEIDGVKDGIITNPRRCKPDLSNLACGASNPSAFVDANTCLSGQQMITLDAIRSNWTSSEGAFLFTTVEPGSEFGWNSSVSGVPYQVGSDYFLYQVLNKTSKSTLSINETELQALLTMADETNPGDIDAMNPDLTQFFSRGGKLMQFHGFGDPLIPAGSSLVYYEKVRSFFNHTDLSDSYNLFMVPGMAHCRDGPGANAFGASSQRDASLGGAGQSLKFDPEHDMILATIDWVENGRKPRSIVTTRWKESNMTNGPDYTRLLCPYPQEGIFKGGDDKNATSYVCGIPT
ncbi:feruloyl esterase B [Rhizoctonia solani]|uniref:Carboxylic ester hydrolase n=1 Tax=Rhizoctonia solani TaxID=456999 RepID=A0A8H8P0T2_9AGAM|nr:feruloyl esterase B [Rhizoctonia solani]QRW22252.1 feruloyl esterase B [Rhizoctonia solani]